MSAKGKPSKKRLDELLVQRGLVESRAKAKALALAGKIRSGTQVLDKPGKIHPEDIELTVIEPPRYVGRGAEKLEGYLKAFPLGTEGIEALDVGASTGGFTDYLLQHGARSVVCVDVGRGQLHAKLRGDPRVTNLEKVNARHLSPDLLPLPDYDLVVMDLSFISLRKVLPAVWPLVRRGGALAALVKPQFEADKKDADRFQGVIRDEALQRTLLDGIRGFARTELPGAEEIGWTVSPIKGADGNREFLLGLRRAN